MTDAAHHATPDVITAAPDVPTAAPDVPTAAMTAPVPQVIMKYLPLLKATIKGDWKIASEIIAEDENAATTHITMSRETALHIAVGANVCCKFVDELVKTIVRKNQTNILRAFDSMGYTALHCAAATGNTGAAKILVREDSGLTLVRKNKTSFPTGTPLKVAAAYAQKNTLWYLLEVTKDDEQDEESRTSSPYTGVDGGDLITRCIAAGFYDVALYLMENYPNLASQRDGKGWTALKALATKPQAFPSGTHGGFWENAIYSLISINQENAFDYPIKGKMTKSPRATTWRKRPGSEETWFTPIHSKVSLMFWNALKYSVPFVKHIHDTKVMHLQTQKLSNLICLKVMEHKDRAIIMQTLGQSMATATEYGVYEIVEDCLEAYPSVLWYPSVERLHWLLSAIKHRQANVYNIIHQLTGHKVWVFNSAVNENEGNNALHMAAKLAPSHRLNTVTGAALQMQRELQWFKEVEARVRPSYRDALNKDKKTPRMLFTDEHAHLVEKGEQWMKTTASSSTVVAALIITMAFAAAFTVPGGNKDQGTHIFLKQIRFRWFIISDAIALFSASTSVLMFLSILTSRYAEEDFLKSLPIKLTIGLLFLFISIAATMNAFGATLALVIHRKGFWIPIAALACIPIMVFALLQSPLLVELVISTYGRSIFRKQSNIILH